MVNVCQRHTLTDPIKNTHYWNWKLIKQVRGLIVYSNISVQGRCKLQAWLSVVYGQNILISTTSQSGCDTSLDSQEI